MSSKSVLRDDRYYINGDCGLILTGNYFKLAASGGNSPTDHTKENIYDADILSTSNPLVSYKYPQDPLPHNNCEVPGFQAALIDFTSNDTLAITNKLNSNIKGSSFNAAVSLGEAGESLRMIGSRARSLASAVKALKKGNLLAFQQALGVRTRVKRSSNTPLSQTAANGTFLEYEYGWRPLVNDIYEAAQYVFQQTNKPISTAYRAKIWRAEVRTASGSNPPYQVGTARSEFHLRCRVTEQYTVAQQLGLDSPSEVAWELLPYSFVCDWVIPVGNYLAARAFLANLKSDIWATEHKSINLKSNFVTNGVYASGYRTYRRIVIKRYLFPHTPPRPSVKSFGQIASWRHAADGVALLISAGKLNKVYTHN